MSCNCSSLTPGLDPASGQTLPLISDVLANSGECATNGSYVEPPCENGDAIQSTTSTGAILSANMTDARCVKPGEGVTLLSRIGNVLAKFVGNGFILIKDSKAYLVSSIPVSITQLWNQYWRPSAVSGVVLGDPHPFPYGVVADKNGNLYGIRGFVNRKTLFVWNFATSVWEGISPDQFPLEVSRALPQSEGIELVGFDPVPTIGSPANVRILKALSGYGIVYLERTATAAGTDPCAEDSFVSVAKVLEFPVIEPGEGEEETGRHRLVYSSLGLRWEASQLEVTDGQDGILGN